MPRIPFIAARLSPTLRSCEAIECRMLDRLEARRQRSEPDCPPPSEADLRFDRHPHVTGEEKRLIRKRAAAYADRARAATGLGHLSSDMRTQLSVLRDGATLVAVPCEDRADEIAADLHEDMPWMAPATERV